MNNWMNFAGLCLNVVGAVILSYSAIISRPRAIEVTAPIWGGNSAAVDERMTGSRNTKAGLLLLALGFLLQLPANWPN